ncbi:hypothetical protein F5X68DRAFT_40564 [Plectosphaerella plurivora]|uniref:Uncharacterized protein n=1 Tax=Plectosphaerella plurivora TaxID=936078 RepID=A0A9P8V4Y0_9PEZI|nr:hypothetical protein F5X68DRAFT_40564 [Plectosphaerella plurivora]
MGTTAASNPPPPPGDIVAVPPPWKLKATVWMFAFHTSKAQAANFPDITYSPLEGSSSFPTGAGASKPLGGLSMIQLISYTDTPVGPYDELILAPGYHEYVVDEDGKRVKKRNARITRIYVSQKYTTWNGRVNWNIPKHMADFKWTDNKDGSRTVKVYPHDTSGGPIEGTASPTPLFQATMKAIPYVPSFPLSLRIFGWLGFDFTLVHPPLPEGKGKHGELPGTDRWAAVKPGQYSPKTSLAWFDMSQTDENGKRPGLYENFWPGLRRWHVGVRMDDSEVDFPEPTVWDPPKSVL